MISWKIKTTQKCSANKLTERYGELNRLVRYTIRCYSFERVISIVETILDLLSPSLGGISAVPIAMLVTFTSFMKRFRVISATSTAVVIAWPLAFRVTT